MKIRLTVEVGDELRRAIARSDDTLPRTRTQLATHEAIGRWITDRVYRAENAAENWLAPEEVTQEERADAAQAIDYLRAAGWDAERVVRWLLAQRAYRLHLRKAVAAAIVPFQPKPRNRDVPRGTYVEDHEDGTD